MRTRIMLETNVLKFSATSLPRLIRINRPTLNAKGEITGMLFYEPGFINPNDQITNPELKRQADLLPRIAELAKESHFELLLDRESTFEGFGVPNMNSADGPFYGAPITQAEPPLKYGRMLFGGGKKPRDWAKNFFIGIRHKRFMELSKAVGGYQGSDQYSLNQLRDAYYIWR